MKRRISIENLEIGTPISKAEMRKNIGGADRDGGTLNDVTIYSDPSNNHYYNDISGVYYNPSTGGHDSAGPSTGGGGGGSSYTPPPPRDLDCTYLPLGDGNNKQVGNTCSLEAFNVVANFFNHKTDFNSVLDNYASYEANKNSTSAVDVKLDLIKNGVTPSEFASFVTTECTGLYTLDNTRNDVLKSSIDGGHPVLGSINMGSDPSSGVNVLHEVAIIGYTDDKQVKYYDPLDARYHTTKLTDFQNLWEVGGLKP